MEVVVLAQPLDLCLAGVDNVYPGHVAVGYLADVAASRHGHCWNRCATFWASAGGRSSRQGDDRLQHTRPVAGDGGRSGVDVWWCALFRLHDKTPILGFIRPL